MKEIALNINEYKEWIQNLKSKVQATQLKAAHTVNKQLIHLYFYIGEQLYAKQQVANWRAK